MEAEFKPALGQRSSRDLKSMLRPDNDPNNHGAHLGSAYQGGWYHYAQKDLRRAARPQAPARPARGRPSGQPATRGPTAAAGSTARATSRRCRSKLAESLGKALGADPKKLYEDDGCAK